MSQPDLEFDSKGNVLPYPKCPFPCPMCQPTLVMEGHIAPYPAGLRDFFAGQALSGIFRADDFNHGPTELARAAYTHADAMLAERDKERK